MAPFSLSGSDSDESVPAEWWSWQPMYTVNLHLPSRFGLVQFKRDLADEKFSYEIWHIYRALFEMFEAEHKYKSVNSMYIDDLSQLHVAPKIMSSERVNVSVRLNVTDFIGSVSSRLNANLQTGHIRSDRYVWFT